MPGLGPSSRRSPCRPRVGPVEFRHNDASRITRIDDGQGRGKSRALYALVIDQSSLTARMLGPLRAASVAMGSASSGQSEPAVGLLVGVNMSRMKPMIWVGSTTRAFRVRAMAFILNTEDLCRSVNKYPVAPQAP